MSYDLSRVGISKLLLTFIFLGTLVWVSRTNSYPTSSFAYGCDNFAYLRAAELFRKNGLIDGLDTGIYRSDTQSLIAIAKGTGLASDRWSHAIAPYCHHFDVTTQKVISQYPPGTSMLMSLFKRGTDGQSTYIVCISSILCFILLSLVNARISFVSVFFNVVVAIWFVRLLQVPLTYTSYSVAWSLTLIPVVVVASYHVLHTRVSVSLLASLVLGGCCGLLISVRLANVFLLIGFGVFLLLQYKLWSISALRRHALPGFIAACAFIAVGILPIVASNFINAGGLLKTTYGDIDAAGAVVTWRVFSQNVRYYFIDGPFSAFTTIAVVICVLSGFINIVLYRSREMICVIAASSAALFISLAFFLTHEVVGSYYLLPIVSTMLLLHLFAWNASASWPPSSTSTAGNWILRAVCVVVIVARLGSLRGGEPFARNIPDTVSASNSLVWSDFTSGSILYYNFKYAARIVATDTCTQFVLADRVMKTNSRLFLIMDSPAMRDLVGRLSLFSSLEDVGTYQLHEPLKIIELKSFDFDKARC